MACCRSFRRAQRNSRGSPRNRRSCFYLCGSDLESGHGFASENLREISECLTYEAVGGYFSGAQAGEAGMDAVNVVLETGAMLINGEHAESRFIAMECDLDDEFAKGRHEMTASAKGTLRVRWRNGWQ